MKYYKYVFLIIAIFLIYNQVFAKNDSDFEQNFNNNKSFRDSQANASLLSGNEIDLLVGTPEGIAEPLDSRRNTITKDNQIDYSKFLDDDALSEESKTDFKWEDAEDSSISDKQVENQLMDLLAETEELEKTDEIFYYYEENETASDSEKI